MDNIMIMAFSIAVPFLLSAVLGWLFIPRVLILSHRRRLYDIPDDRKMHDRPVPRLGGITFLPILLICICLTIGFWVMLGVPYVTDRLNLMMIRFCLLFVGMMMLFLVSPSAENIFKDIIFAFDVPVIPSLLSEEAATTPAQ